MSPRRVDDGPTGQGFSTASVTSQTHDYRSQVVRCPADALARLIAVLIFTVVQVVADPLVTKVAIRSVPALRGGVALVSTFLGLLVTTWISSGLQIDGLKTWLLATLVVWLAALIADLILQVLLVKKAVDQKA